MSTDAKNPASAAKLDAGQRLQCNECRSEVEIIQPCGCTPSDMVLSCCGKPMTPIPGQDVHVGVE